MGKFHFPLGVRFHPTEQELVSYYLKRKVSGREMETELIGEIDLYQFEPWDLPGRSSLQTKDLEWYFFSPRDRKYPHGFRNNRVTEAGYWKATGKDRAVSSGSKTVGKKKTLVYYRGRAPRGERTDWVMHEYRLDDKDRDRLHASKNGFVLCRVFQKSGRGPKNGEQYGAPYEDDDSMSLPAVGGEAAGKITVENQEPGLGVKELQLGETVVAGADSFTGNQTAGHEISSACEGKHEITDLGRILESSHQYLDSFLEELLANSDSLRSKNNPAQTQIVNTNVEIPVILDEKYITPSVDHSVVGSMGVPAFGYSPVTGTNASSLESAKEEDILNEIYCQVMGEQEVVNETTCTVMQNAQQYLSGTAESFDTMPIDGDFLELNDLELLYYGLGEPDNKTHNLDSIDFARHCRQSSSPLAQMRLSQQHIDLCHEENAQSTVTQGQELKSENEMQKLEGSREQCQQNPMLKTADERRLGDCTDIGLPEILMMQSALHNGSIDVHKQDVRQDIFGEVPSYSDFWDMEVGQMFSSNEATGLEEPHYDSILCENMDYLCRHFRSKEKSKILENFGLNEGVSYI